MRVHIMSICLLMGVAALQSCRTAGTSTTKDIGGSPANFNCTPGKLTDGPGGSKFSQICPGTFMMGSPDSESGRYPVEGPQHQVTISKAFEMQTTEVTYRQVYSVLGPDVVGGGSLSPLPADWNKAQEFISELNRLGDGYYYRLPTEAEWEYAARAGTTGAYAGDLDAMAWYNLPPGSEATDVATKKPNAWGLYDMQGNVAEWTADFFGDYSPSAVTDPKGPSTGYERVLRGCSYMVKEAKYCRSAFRIGSPPRVAPFRGLGIRIVRTSSW